MFARMQFAALATTAIVTSLASTPALAQVQVQVHFNLPAQELSKSLKDVARVTGTNVVFDPAHIAGKRAPTLHGAYTAEAAIKQLIAGQSLVLKNTGSGTWVVSTEGNAGAGEPAAPSGEGSVGSATAGSESADQQEIVVTAQKREERLINVPQSVSVIGSQQLQRLGATQFRDFADTVPGLSFETNGAGQNKVVLRGVTAGNDVISTVGIYVDEVPYGSSSAFARASLNALDVALFDLDRLEVLRGPQGTLYGASTMGGLIKYVTKLPDSSQFSVDTRAGVSVIQDGGTSYYGDAAINLPISQGQAALRLSGFYSHDGGYIDNITLGQKDVNRARIRGGRADLLLNPTDRMTVRITGFVQDIHRNGMGTADYLVSGKPIVGSLDQERRLPEPYNQQFRLGSATVTYDFGGASLTSVSSYQTGRTADVTDYSALYVPIFAIFGLPYSAVGATTDVRTKKLTQEVRLASSGHKTLEWLIGGFYTNESTSNHQAFILRDLQGNPAPNILFTYSAPTRYREVAGFGDLTWHLTPRFDVTGGIRYAANHQTFTQIGSGLFIGSIPTRHSRDSVVTYLANARYKLNAHVTAYARFATGYRPGGPNIVADDPVTGLPLASPTFGPDHLYSYEAGLKGDSADHKFSFDVDGYFINWKDIQIVASRNGFGVYANALGGATVRGAEATLAYRPIENFTLQGAFAYQDAHLSQADPDLGGAAGERLPLVPRLTATLNGDYQLSQSRLRPRLGATFRYVSDRFISFDKSPYLPQYRLPPYADLDLRGAITVGRFDAQLYVRNVLNARGQLGSPTVASVFGGPIQVAILQPRTFGLSLSAAF